MSKEIEQKIRVLMATATGIEVTDPERSLQSLAGWDSLRFAEFIISLQQEFGIRLTPSEIAGLVNLESAFQLVQNKKGP